MYFLKRMVLVFIVLLIIMMYDYNNYNFVEKENEIKDISSKMVFTVAAFSFKSIDYKRFVYDK
ncbi:MAG: hypothetical protein ACJAWW_001190 [Sulfurimonas sp.]|jgi:hypothetical protein